MKPNLTAAYTGTFPDGPAGAEESITAELDMDSLLDQYPVPDTPQRFTTVQGHVVARTNAGLFVDIGGKTESFCAFEEAGDLKPGDTATFIVWPGREENMEDGAVRLSYARQKGFSQATELHTSKNTGAALVTEVLANGAGLTVECCGLKGFLPRSEVDVIGSVDSLFGKQLPVKVITAERSVERGQLRTELVVSHKQATRETKLAFLDTLHVGDTIGGVVLRILMEKAPRRKDRAREEPVARQELGALIDLGNLIVGFVHRSEASFSRWDKPSAVLPVGQPVTATIIDINRETLEVRLSTRRHTINRAALSNLAKGDTVKGVVRHVLLERADRTKPSLQPPRELGLLVELGDRLTGFIHPREVSPDQNSIPSHLLPIGTQIKAEIVAIDERTGQLRLSLNPMREEVIATLAEGKVVQGVARQFGSIGYFIRLGGTVEGLLHHRELRCAGGQPETVEDNAVIDVKVLRLTPDPERRRTNIALSRKF